MFPLIFPDIINVCCLPNKNREKGEKNTKAKPHLCHNKQSHFLNSIVKLLFVYYYVTFLSRGWVKRQPLLYRRPHYFTLRDAELVIKEISETHRLQRGFCR